MPGNSQRTMGAMILEERWEDFVSLDAEKMTAIHITTGSQYLVNDRNAGTAHGSVEIAHCRVSNKSYGDPSFARRAFDIGAPVPPGAGIDVPARSVKRPFRFRFETRANCPILHESGLSPRIQEILQILLIVSKIVDTCPP